MGHVRLGHSLPTHQLTSFYRAIGRVAKLTRPMGRMKRSSLTGFRVKPSPTNVALLTMRFQLLFLCLPVLMTLKISSSAMPRTLGRGTAYFAARSLRRSLTADDRALAFCGSGQLRARDCNADEEM